MEACEVEFSIFKIVGYEFDTKPEELRPSTSLMDDLKADSLALMNLAMEIEERFNIKTIGDITSYVKRSLETAPKGTA